jgi:pectate lyase
MSRYTYESQLLCRFALAAALALLAPSATTQESISSVTMTNLPAFPGAEGYGARTDGGRGGRVIEVTNLNASGPGSLRAACEAAGPRMVIFKVAGTIDGDIHIESDSITVAGQSAPGDGITIKGNLTIDASDVIIRYIRVRTDHEGDALGGRYDRNIILDHVSASWSSDEVLSLYHNEYVTIQWCVISEACAKADGSHRFGGIWGNQFGTYHHNLIAHNDSRNPRWASGCGYNDYRNNVVYNWGYESCYGGEAHQKGDRRMPPIEFSTINMVANFYKPGPATRGNVKTCIVSPSSRGDDDYGSWYLADNHVEGAPEVSRDNWLGVIGKSYNRLGAAWDSMRIHQQTPQEAYEVVIQQAGCSLPKRDSIDARIIEELREGRATHGKDGIISSPSDVGGWPELQNAEAPRDSDSDGLPDEWELRFKLEPLNALDGQGDRDKDGYTNLEEFLNGTDPTEFVDYKNPANNVNVLH